MIKDYTVSITYKNSDLDDVRTKSYRFDEYCNDIRNGVLAIIGDVERTISDLNGEPDKNKWPEKTKNQFNKIKHKIFDAANNVARLPQNTCYKGHRIIGVDVAELIAEALNK